MLTIGFLFQGMSSPSEGIVRPFLNFAKGLDSKKDVTACFVCLDCSKDFCQYIQPYGKVICSDSIDYLIKEISKIKIDFILSDDGYNRLKILSKIKQKLDVPTGVYIQIFFGMHTIINTFDISYLSIKEKFLFKVLRYLPFILFKARYAELLKRNNIVISNSIITKTVLELLYDIDSNGVVYPPIDTQIFMPASKNKKNKILVYLGSHSGDTNKEFLVDICRNILTRNYDILLFGNRKLGKILTGRINGSMEYISDINDEELSKIYSECKLVICPQRWEQFGYVPVEAMACGTPVLAFNHMGPSETILDGLTGWLASTNSEFIRILNIILEKKLVNNLDSGFCKDHAVNFFSIEVSIERLLKSLRN